MKPLDMFSPNKAPSCKKTTKSGRGPESVKETCTSPAFIELTGVPQKIALDSNVDYAVSLEHAQALSMRENYFIPMLLIFSPLKSRCISLANIHWKGVRDSKTIVQQRKKRSV